MRNIFEFTSLLLNVWHYGLSFGVCGKKKVYGRIWKDKAIDTMFQAVAQWPIMLVTMSKAASMLWNETGKQASAYFWD